MTGASGFGSFSATLPLAVSSTNWITATATALVATGASTGDTSEFSLSIRVRPRIVPLPIHLPPVFDLADAPTASLASELIGSSSSGALTELM
jgi:hypothetical protein